MQDSPGGAQLLGLDEVQIKSPEDLIEKLNNYVNGVSQLSGWMWREIQFQMTPDIQVQFLSHRSRAWF